MTYTENEVKDMFAAAARESDPFKKACRFSDARRAMQTIDADLSPGDKARRQHQSAAQPITFTSRDTVEQKIAICVPRLGADIAKGIMATKKTLCEKLGELCARLALPIPDEARSSYNLAGKTTK